MLKLYNSYSNSLEEVLLSKDKVKVYLCGPTVQSSPHIGHGRSAVVFDFFIRYLKYLDFNISFVRNITDIEDKIILKSAEQNIDFKELAENVTKEFKDAYSNLNCIPPDVEPKATEYIDEILLYIQKILDEDMGYVSESGVYFDTASYADYLKLSGRKIDEVISGTRVDIVEDKKAPEDFVLWKFAKEGEPYWESTWGKGRPGWHIECSAMINSILGNDIDFHCGGNDLIFPHHENELAQSKAAYPDNEFVKYWLHNGMINLSGKKMSKSEGNSKFLNDYIDEYGGDVMRFYFLRAQYRSPQEFIGEVFTQINNAASLDEKMLGDLKSTLRYIFQILGFTFEKTSTKRVSIDEIKIFFEGYGVSFTSVEQAMNDFLVIRETYRSNQKYEIADNMRTDALNIGIKIEDGNDNGWSWNNN